MCDIFYDWNRDFPIIYQNRKNGLKTIFKLEFLLSEAELLELNKITNTRINSRDLTLQIEIGPNNEMEIKFHIHQKYIPKMFLEKYLSCNMHVPT